MKLRITIAKEVKKEISYDDIMEFIKVVDRKKSNSEVLRKMLRVAEIEDNPQVIDQINEYLEDRVYDEVENRRTLNGFARFLIDKYGYRK